MTSEQMDQKVEPQCAACGAPMKAILDLTHVCEVAPRPYCLRCEHPIYRDSRGVWRREATGSDSCPRNPARDGHEPAPRPPERTETPPWRLTRRQPCNSRGEHIVTCSHPEKDRHATRRAALKARDSLEATKGIDLGLEPYPCGDHWHLGHRHKRNRLERKYSTRGSK